MLVKGKHMNINKYPRSIVAAAKLLDELEPNWALKITEDINMSDASRCILGQVFGEYFKAFEKLFHNIKYDDNKCCDKIFGEQANVKTWQKEVDKRVKTKKEKEKENMTFAEALYHAQKEKVPVYNLQHSIHIEIGNITGNFHVFETKTKKLLSSLESCHINNNSWSISKIVDLDNLEPNSYFIYDGKKYQLKKSRSGECYADDCKGIITRFYNGLQVKEVKE